MYPKFEYWEKKVLSSIIVCIKYNSMDISSIILWINYVENVHWKSSIQALEW